MCMVYRTGQEKNRNTVGGHLTGVRNKKRSRSTSPRGTFRIPPGKKLLGKVMKDEELPPEQGKLSSWETQRIHEVLLLDHSLRKSTRCLEGAKKRYNANHAFVARGKRGERILSKKLRPVGGRVGSSRTEQVNAKGRGQVSGKENSGTKGAGKGTQTIEKSSRRGAQQKTKPSFKKRLKRRKTSELLVDRIRRLRGREKEARLVELR